MGRNTSSAAVINELRRMFATHGIPDVIVSANWPAFAAEEFQSFLQRDSVRRALVSPCHPASNAQAERFVRETKKALKAFPRGDVELRLIQFLLEQHILSSTSTGQNPAELMMGRRLRTALDCFHPDGTPPAPQELRQFDSFLWMTPFLLATSRPAEHVGCRPRP